MKLDQNSRKLLRCLYEKYHAAYGASMSQLGRFTIPIMDDDIRKAMPDLFGNDPNLEKLKMLLLELSVRGFVVVSPPIRDIFLTEKGYTEVFKSKWRRCVDYFNSNPGLAIIISVISLVISFIALFND